MAYPDTIYTYTTRNGTETLLLGQHTLIHNEAAGEIIAIQTELGTNVKGSFPTVRDRLEGLEAAILGAGGHVQNSDAGTASPTFYLNGSSGYLLKGNSGVSVRNNLDTAYADFRCAGLTCDSINGISAATLNSLTVDTHNHTNKVLIDQYTQTEADLASAVILMHVQNTDTGSDNETFQLNNVNPLNSAKIKVDDLTPTIVDIRNAADSAFAPIRASEFRGELQANNADPNRPTIEYNEGTNTWQFSNDGVNFFDITTAPGFTVSDTASVDLTLAGINLTAAVLPAGVDHDQLLNYAANEHFTVAGAANELQYNNGAGGLASEAAFYYNPATDTLYTPNINVSGLIVGAVVAGGTTFDSWTINSDGFSLQLDTAGMAANRVINGETLYQAVLNNHVAATAGTGISVVGQQVTNTDLGSSAVTAHNLAFTHADIALNTAARHAAASVTDSTSVDFTLAGQDITAVVLPAGVDHNSLNNYDANRHVDHTAVSISTGTGLTGGGDISATRTLSLSHLGIQSLADPNADRLMIWDDTDGSVQWVTVGTGLTYTTATHTLSAAGTTTFLGLTDTPAAYTGGSLQAVRVNVGETALEFYTPVTGASLTRATFTNASLTAGVLTITHSGALAAPYTAMVTIFDNNFQQIIPDSITGATNTVAVDLGSYVTAGGGSIAGTWGYAYIV